MEPKFRFCALVVAFLATSLQSSITAAYSTIPIKVRDNGRLLVPVALNGNEDYTLLFDTGATTTVISEKVATKIGIAATRTARVQTFAGPVPLAVGRLEELSIGGHRIEGQEVLIGNLERLFRLDGDIQGILGQDVLSRFNYILDRPHRKLEIEETDHQGTAPSGTKVSFERRGGKIYVQVVAAGLRLILDSGNPYLVLYEDVARKLNPITVDAGGSGVVSSFVGGREIEMARIPELRIGDKLFRNVQALVTARQPGRYEDGFLPLHFFDSIYINNVENFLILNPERTRK